MPTTSLQPFNPLTRASIRPRGRIPTFAEPPVQIEPSLTMAPVQPADLEQSIRNLQSQYQQQHADIQKAIGPLQTSINDLSSKIVDTYKSMEPQDPYELDFLRNTAETAQTQNEKAALELRGPQKRTYTPFQFDQGAYPRQGTLPVPERPEAKVNPVAS